LYFALSPAVSDPVKEMVKKDCRDLGMMFIFIFDSRQLDWVAKRDGGPFPQSGITRISALNFPQTDFTGIKPYKTAVI